MTISVAEVTKLSASELEQLCQATEDAIADGIGFNWQHAPARETIETYWKGVMMVPERHLFVGKLDGTVVSSIQLVRPGKNNQMQAFAATVFGHFVAPWARGHGLAKALLQAAEQCAKTEGFSVLKLDVRETQEAAMALYESCDYVRWGILPQYEYLNGVAVAGHFFYKEIS